MVQSPDFCFLCEMHVTHSLTHQRRKGSSHKWSNI